MLCVTVAESTADTEQLCSMRAYCSNDVAPAVFFAGEGDRKATELALS